MREETNVNRKIVRALSNGPDKKERTKRNEHMIGIQRGGNFTIVSTTLLIGLKIKVYEIFAKQHANSSLVFQPTSLRQNLVSVQVTRKTLREEGAKL